MSADNSKIQAQKKIAFIINSKSGRQRKIDYSSAVRAKLDLQHYKPSFYFTEYKGHATQLAKQLTTEGFSIIIAIGGDGTVNEIASALVGKDVLLGIIPTGSGNGLANHLGIPHKLNDAVGVINKAQTEKIDAGRINKKWFFCTCGTGFDAHIGHEFAEENTRGFRSYIKVIMREFSRYKARKYKFTIDGTSYKRRAFLITIANAGQYGNNAYIAPDASIKDGIFDVCILKPFPLIKTVLLAMRLFNRTIGNDNSMEVIRGKEIIFKKSKKKYVFHYDGEPISYRKRRKVKISIKPDSLNVIIHRGKKNKVK